MFRKSTHHFGSAAIAAALLLGASHGPAIAANEQQLQGETEWAVDYRGRPPFKRERVPVETVDVAALETSAETTVVWERSNRGRPPFKRQWAEVPVVDAASLEIDEEGTGTVFRGRPPFKRN